jgi:hypothetical protein
MPRDLRRGRVVKSNEKVIIRIEIRLIKLIELIKIAKEP